jgi:type I restriction enzyme S subunit
MSDNGKWPLYKLGNPDVCILNPKKREISSLPDDTFVSFVPMAKVDDVSGLMDALSVKKIGEVRKGYTYFAEGDVVFAKITPCMENGKSAIARNLHNGIGFGTTEFHVLRPGPLVVPEWLHFFVRRLEFRLAAKKSMQGAAGQQRVPIDFLRHSEMPVLPFDEQRRIVARIEELTRRAEEARRLRQEATKFFTHIRPSYIRRVIKRCEVNGWEKVQLGDKRISKIVMGQSPSGNTYNRNQQGLPLLNGPTEFGDCHPFPIQWTTDSKRQCEKGDILFCVRGSTTGRMNWADQIYSIGRGIAAIRPNTGNVLQEFLYSMIEIQVSEILHNAEGGVFPNFSKDQLSALIIPVPPMKEQKKIVEELVSLKKKSDEMSSLQQNLIQELVVFQSALLAKAFRGEL